MLRDTSPSQPPTTRRLLISEEGLIDEIGHWYEYCKAVSDIHEDRGIECLVAMHADAKPEVRTDLKALAVYPRTIWGAPNSRSALKRYLKILSHNLLVYKTMHRLIRKIGPVDVVFAPTVTIHHLIGWRLFSAMHVGRDCKRLVLLFRNNVGYYTSDSDVPKFKRPAVILSFLLKSFAPLIKAEKVAFATDSERLAIEYEALCGLRPTVFPSPRIAPSSQSAPTDDKQETPSQKPTSCVVFSCLGPARFEKGINILQEAIKLVLARRPSPDVSFVIQWNSDIRDVTNSVYLPDPALLADSRVRLITKSLSSDEYNREISLTDCMVLPYRRDSYFARISGVAVEGVTAGKPIIYTLDTWCEGLVNESGAGIGVPDGDIEKLAWSIEEIADNFALYRERALAKVEGARLANSADAFFEKLWGPM